MHLAIGLLGSDERVHGPMRSLDCSQQGDLSSAPLIARESTNDLIAAVVGGAGMRATVPSWARSPTRAAMLGPQMSR